MAHQIIMKVPEVTLSGQDVIFEVFIDDEKRGELHVSKGDLRWRPRRSRKTFAVASWEQFANWMETDL